MNSTSAKIIILPIVARPTAWNEQRVAMGNEPGVIILPVIRIERLTDNSPRQIRQRRRRATVGTNP